MQETKRQLCPNTTAPMNIFAFPVNHIPLTSKSQFQDLA